MRFYPLTLLQRLCLSGLLGLALAWSAQAQPSPQASPEKVVQDAANQTLQVLKTDGGVRNGDLRRVNEVVNQYILPYVDFQKTTRLAAGRYWRQATPQQREALAEAFKGTLVRTYSGALTRVDNGTNIKVTGSTVDGTDAVVRSTINQSNGQSVGVDYRLEQSSAGWKIYDLNVEGIWLIQNYRNQFAQEINQNGIDGLIKALNQRNAQ
ncbi:MlaC/ttg2D family ABC transporter substrate-binding protein [Bordetella genomosp. 11]|uniref:ABC transporter n=1 Tax=Bordetella genomosp. 11 TaxID=1416808 RepID=A0A261UY94_9BORD|nr:ABC transporter substrate-binding protein [Bordetella genomosp. 11]OZI66322.1 ABC transporter [Bordetella genomosp. 11]